MSPGQSAESGPDLPYRLVRLVNGSYSVHSCGYRETFHPVVGPVAEAEALYVKQLGLRARFQAEPQDFVIWDVGLGAAANSVTVLRGLQDCPGRIQMISFDQTLDPLRFALRHTDRLGYLAGFETVLDNLARHPEQPHAFQSGPLEVAWQVCTGNFPTLLSQPIAKALPKPHAILYDAYSPAVNPEMWTGPVFRALFELLDPARPCALPTYSRSTLLRVTLLLAGFYVGVGHATGEKEETTIAANAPELIAEPLDARWLKRVRNSSSAEPLWEPAYRQAPLSSASWEKLQAHPQFR